MCRAWQILATALLAVALMGRGHCRHAFEDCSTSALWTRTLIGPSLWVILSTRRDQPPPADMIPPIVSETLRLLTGSSLIRNIWLCNLEARSHRYVCETRTSRRCNHLVAASYDQSPLRGITKFANAIRTAPTTADKTLRRTGKCGPRIAGRAIRNAPIALVAMRNTNVERDRLTRTGS
jgi:hypothetical protein